MKHLFGPVPSRRLGISLGIDLTPQKACTLNCVYCECGKTDALTLERKEYIPTGEVIAELEDYLSADPELDAITFSGSGEPTLHSGIGEIIAWLKREYPQHRVVVLTNGTLLWQPEVREALMPADLVVPSLDAVSEDIFHRINRPNKNLSNAEIIEGLVTFCDDFEGEVWLEVFLIPGVNDTPEELERFREVFERLRVDRIQLNSLDRPGAMPWVEPMPRENLMAIADMLGDEVEVIGKPIVRRRCASFSENLRGRILATIRVRPSTIDDLAVTLGMHVLDIGKYLDVMIGEGEVEQHRGERGVFYQAMK